MAQAQRLICHYLKRPSMWLLLCAGLVAVSLSAMAQDDTAQIARGEAQFNEWCLACHDANLPWSGGGTLALDAKYQGELPGNLLERTDLTADLVRSVVRSGMFRMPPFRLTEIDEDELEDLAAFLTRNSSN